MKAVRKRGSARRKQASIAGMLDGLGITRAQWLTAAAVAGVLALGGLGYWAWRSYSNRTVDYAAQLKTSPGYRSYTIGISAAQAGRTQEAETAFQRAIQEAPGNALPYNALATLYVNQGDVQKAIVTAENGVVSAPGSPDLYYTLGLARYQSGRFPEAEQSLERALELDPHLAAAAMWLGNTYLIESKFGGGEEGGDPTKLTAAIEQFRRAVALDDSVADYHAALAEGLYQHRDLDEARKQMERALEIDPNNAKYAYSLGRVCDQLNDLDAAEAAFKKSTERDPTNAEAYYGLGLVYSKKQQDEQAVEALRDALKNNPFHADAHEKLGQTLIRMGQQDEGQAELQRAEDSRGRAKKLLEMQRASAADPGNAELANNVGIELARQGDLEEAMQAFHRALAANPRYIDAKYQIAGIYASRGKFLEAIEAFMDVDKAQPGYRKTNYYLARLNEKIQRKSEAQKRQAMYDAQVKNGTATE